MRPSLKGLTKRVADSAESAAAGTPVPAGQDPPTAEQLQRAGARERGAMRRRLRKLRHTREALVTDLGGLVVELHRHGRADSPLIGQRVKQIAELDAEMRGLAQALGSELTLGQVVVAGIAGTCTRCGTIVATSDRFCSNCGASALYVATEQERQAPPPTVAIAAGEKPPPPTDAKPLDTAGPPPGQRPAAPQPADGDGAAAKPPPPKNAKPLETAAPPPAAR